MHRMKTIEELDFAKNDVGLNSSFISLSFFFSKLGTAIFLFLIVVIKWNTGVYYHCEKYWNVYSNAKFGA